MKLRTRIIPFLVALHAGATLCLTPAARAEDDGEPPTTPATPAISADDTTTSSTSAPKAETSLSSEASAQGFRFHGYSQRTTA